MLQMLFTCDQFTTWLVAAEPSSESSILAVLKRLFSQYQLVQRGMLLNPIELYVALQSDNFFSHITVTRLILEMLDTDLEQTQQPNDEQEQDAAEFLIALTERLGGEMSAETARKMSSVMSLSWNSDRTIDRYGELLRIEIQIAIRTKTSTRRQMQPCHMLQLNIYVSTFNLPASRRCTHSSIESQNHRASYREIQGQGAYRP